MEKAPNKTYRSFKVLGQLFDMARTQNFKFQATYESPFDSRILRRYKLPQEMLKKARQIKTLYDRAMRRIMGQLEIETEFEVFSTFVLRRPRFSSDYKMQERLGHESFTLKQVHRDMCRKEVGGPRDVETLGPFVAAMYQVTFEEVQIALHEARQEHVQPDGTVSRRRINPKSMPLISFPWLFDDILGKLARGTDRQPSLEDFGIKVQQKPAKAHAAAPNDDAENDPTKLDYMRTEDGLIIHRGEVLNLFGHESDDEYDLRPNGIYDPPLERDRRDDEEWITSVEAAAADPTEKATDEEVGSPAPSSPMITSTANHADEEDYSGGFDRADGDSHRTSSSPSQEDELPRAPRPESGQDADDNDIGDNVTAFFDSSARGRDRISETR